MLEPRQLARDAEDSPSLPIGTEERFSGYGVMGLPFRSGHVLALRRFPASSIGRGYTSVWHRDPAGDWTFYQDVSPEEACPRYFGPSVRRSLERPIDLRWTAPSSFFVEVDGGLELEWNVTLAAPAAFRAMNAVASILPDSVWHNGGALRAMGAMARGVLGTGRLALAGRAPSGQRFVANPLVAWAIPWTRACVRGVDLGEVGPLPQQEHLGDFWIPQRGLFVIGRAFFEAHEPAARREECAEA